MHLWLGCASLHSCGAPSACLHVGKCPPDPQYTAERFDQRVSTTDVTACRVGCQHPIIYSGGQTETNTRDDPSPLTAAAHAMNVLGLVQPAMLASPTTASHPTTSVSIRQAMPPLRL